MRNVFVIVGVWNLILFCLVVVFFVGKVNLFLSSYVYIKLLLDIECWKLRVIFGVWLFELFYSNLFLVRVEFSKFVCCFKLRFVILIFILILLRVFVVMIGLLLL